MHENPQSNNPITYVLLNPYLLNHRITSSKKTDGQKFTLESPNFNKISEETTKYTRQVQSRYYQTTRKHSKMFVKHS